jgi:hypothetical protein
MCVHNSPNPLTTDRTAQDVFFPQGSLSSSYIIGLFLRNLLDVIIFALVSEFVSYLSGFRYSILQFSLQFSHPGIQWSSASISSSADEIRAGRAIFIYCRSSAMRSNSFLQILEVFVAQHRLLALRYCDCI